MELGSMQSRLIVQLEEARFLPLLLTLAENAGKGEYEEYNVLVLDSLWLMFRAVEVDDLLRESSQVRASFLATSTLRLKFPISHVQVAAEALAKLLDEEDRSKQQAKRTGNSRHSRFGTTIVMKAVSQETCKQTYASSRLSISPSGFRPICTAQAIIYIDHCWRCPRRNQAEAGRKSHQTG